jgi:hypothetical protein
MLLIRRTAAAILIAGAAGCTMRTGDMTLVSTKNIPSLHAESRGQFEASDCKVFGVASLEEAIDRAIEKGDGNALTDASLYFDQGFFQVCFRAKGTVVKIEQGGE